MRPSPPGHALTGLPARGLTFCFSPTPISVPNKSTPHKSQPCQSSHCPPSYGHFTPTRPKPLGGFLRHFLCHSPKPPLALTPISVTQSTPPSVLRPFHTARILAALPLSAILSVAAIVRCTCCLFHCSSFCGSFRALCISRRSYSLRLRLRRHSRPSIATLPSATL